MLRHRALALAGALVAAGLATEALAQGSSQSTQPPVLPAPQNNSSVPEKIAPDIKCQDGAAPCTTGSTGGSSGSGATLSEKLERSDGVIRPPAGIAPDMNSVRPPAPNPGTTPVIRPPGSPGGNPNVDPK